MTIKLRGAELPPVLLSALVGLMRVVSPLALMAIVSLEFVAMNRSWWRGDEVVDDDDDEAAG